MGTEQFHLAGIDIEVVHKSIKNLHIGVYPPDGSVRVVAPPSMSSDGVRVAVLTKLPWIEKRRRDFQQQPRENTRAYVSGKTHWHLGRPLRLRVETVTPRRPGIQVEGNEALPMRLRPIATFVDRDAWFLEGIVTNCAPVGRMPQKGGPAHWMCQNQELGSSVCARRGAAEILIPVVFGSTCP